MKPWHYITAGIVLLLLFRRRVSANPLSPVVTIPELARAVARAEGYYVPGSAPNRNNNPGSIYTGGQFNSYATPEAGFAALESLLIRAVRGQGPYSTVSTWREMAWMYVNGTRPNAPIGHASDEANGGPDQWLLNVFSGLGKPDIDPNSEVSSYVAV